VSSQATGMSHPIFGMTHILFGELQQNLICQTAQTTRLWFNFAQFLGLYQQRLFFLPEKVPFHPFFQVKI
jgi:hypothetical protein